MKLRFILEKANAAKAELLHDIDYFLDEHDLYVKAIWEIQKVTGNKKDKKVDLVGSRSTMNKTIEQLQGENERLRKEIEDKKVRLHANDPEKKKEISEKIIA